MTLETFNLLLAVGGGITVPATVGAVATYLVRRHDKALFTTREPSPEVATHYGLDQKAVVHDDRIPA